MRIPLPDGAGFEIERRWGHIGRPVPATLVYALGAPGRK